MRYVCLGYIEAGKFENLTESERNAMVTAASPTTTCCAGTATSPAGKRSSRRSAVTLRFRAEGDGHRRPICRDQEQIAAS